MIIAYTFLFFGLLICQWVFSIYLFIYIYLGWECFRVRDYGFYFYFPFFCGCFYKREIKDKFEVLVAWWDGCMFENVQIVHSLYLLLSHKNSIFSGVYMWGKLILNVSYYLFIMGNDGCLFFYFFFFLVAKFGNLEK